MEKAIAIFKSPDTDRTITINFTYNKETSDLDYNIEFDKNTSAKDALDLPGFLAHMFLTSLQVNKNKDE